MKKFLTTFFAVIGFIVVAIVVGIITASSIKKEKMPVSLPSKMVLTLALQNGLMDAPPKSNIFASFGNTPSAQTVQNMIQALDLARQDTRVVGLALRLDMADFGLATTQEFRDALLRFKKSGKKTYLYADDLGSSPAMGEYWLASAFDEIWLQPIGDLALTGFSAELPFAKNLLDKVGIEAEILHAGKYKSYPETVMRDSATDANREMTSDMLAQLSNHLIREIATSRGISVENLEALMKRSPLTSEEALVEGLIDSIGYRDEFDDYLEQATDGAETLAFEEYQEAGPRPVPGEKMALIYVSGALTTATAEEAMGGDIVSADEIAETLADAADDKNIKAILVRVDSPGGTPLAADIIRRAIQLARAQKPVIISMANTAASGGYWMSTTANAIVAQPTTLTGSIGVFGGKLNAAALWKKLGVNWESFPGDDNASLWSMNQPYSMDARVKVQSMIDHSYREFINRVATGRNLDPAAVEKIAQGRVWTGTQAKEIGLVDSLGGLDVAITAAKTFAKIPERQSVTLEILPKPTSPFEQLIKLAQQGFPFSLMGAWMTDSFKASMDHFITTQPVLKPLG